MAKSKISADVKAFIVQCLACFDTPSTIVEAVKREYSVTVSRQLVETYDPTKRAGSGLAVVWRDLFSATRSDFLADTGKIAISHRTVRLRALDRMAARAEERGNMPLAAQLLEQAAKEMGDSFTNRRELTGKDGKDLPVPVSPVTIFQLPDNGRG